MDFVYGSVLPNRPQLSVHFSTEPDFLTFVCKIFFFHISFFNKNQKKQMATTQISRSTELKQITRSMYAALQNRQFDQFAALMADDARDYGQGPQVVVGRDNIMAGLKGLFSAFPDYAIQLEDIAVSDNRVYAKNTFTGTQTQPLMGSIPPTHQKVVWTDTDILEFNEEGKIVAHWANNPNEILYQLGYGAMANPNTHVVIHAYQCFGKGDVAGILALCAENVVWDATDNPLLAHPRLYRGQADFGQFFKDLANGATITKFEPRRFLADGSDVVAFSDCEFTQHGKAQKDQVVHHFTIKNGKIVSAKEFSSKPVAI
jgi:ketosteroid isomerase-like protein/predicted ester cyclase